jgi:epoxide hydrolase-like predicted phosphatase
VATAPTALLVDYGGVLTSSPAESFRQWLDRDGLDASMFRDLLRRWFAKDATTNIAHDLETGRISPGEFERALAAELARPDGSMVASDGLLDRMFAGMRAELPMIDVVRRVRSAGVRTGLVSNSWGFDYPRQGWGSLFDAVVISAEVGVRKPDPEIYLLAADRLGVSPATCVYVDDLEVNARGAAAVGMVGIHHTTLESTVAELEILFDMSLQ